MQFSLQMFPEPQSGATTITQQFKLHALITKGDGKSSNSHKHKIQKGRFAPCDLNDI